MRNVYIVTRYVTVDECEWLDREYVPGEIVYEYNGPTYGCIAHGVAVSKEPGEIPFFEFPRDAIEAIGTCV